MTSLISTVLTETMGKSNILAETIISPE